MDKLKPMIFTSGLIPNEPSVPFMDFCIRVTPNGTFLFEELRQESLIKFKVTEQVSASSLVIFCLKVKHYGLVR